MSIIASWKDAILLLRPRNLPIFLGACWLTLTRSYRFMFRYGWWILLLIGFAYGLLDLLGIPINSTVFFFCLLLFIFASIRPSTQHKEGREYARYALRHTLSLALGMIPIILLVMFISGQSQPFSGATNFSWSLWDWTTFAGPSYITPLLTFFALFQLDSDTLQECELGASSFTANLTCIGSSLWRAVKLFLYAFPVCLLWYLVSKYTIAWLYENITLRLYATEWLGSIATNILQYATTTSTVATILVRVLDIILAAILWPIAIAPLVVIYIKWVHERFSVFFTNP